MTEKRVFELRVPACAVIKKIISSPKHGIVGAMLEYLGREITFFRTDFLELERVAWDVSEKFSDTWFHEDVPKEVIESVRKNHGFFLTKEYLDEKGGSYNEAVELAENLNIPELRATLPYGVIYDTLGVWLMENGFLSESEWLCSPQEKSAQKEILNRDCGGATLGQLLGNIFEMEWTNEKFADKVVAREGQPFSDGEGNYFARKRYIYRQDFRIPEARTRAFLYF